MVVEKVKMFIRRFSKVVSKSMFKQYYAIMIFIFFISEKKKLHQSSILINSCTELSKTQFFPVSVANKNNEGDFYTKFLRRRESVHINIFTILCK